MSDDSEVRDIRKMDEKSAEEWLAQSNEIHSQATVRNAGRISKVERTIEADRWKINTLVTSLAVAIVVAICLVLYAGHSMNSAANKIHETYRDLATTPADVKGVADGIDRKVDELTRKIESLEKRLDGQ